MTPEGTPDSKQEEQAAEASSGTPDVETTPTPEAVSPPTPEGTPTPTPEPPAPDDDAPPPPPEPRRAKPVKPKPSPTAGSGPRRNKPCPCGSGKKYKNCCLPKQQMEAASAMRAARLPEAARALLGDFIQFLMETGQFDMVAYLKPEAWEMLALQTLHAKYLMFRRQEAMRMQQERQNDPAFLQQQREGLIQQLGQVDQALAVAQQAQQQGPAKPPEAGNTSPASPAPEAP